MARRDVKLLYGGFNEVRKSPGMQALLRDVAERVASRAGDGHSIDVSDGWSRSRSYVSADTYDARRAEATGGNLTRALLNGA